MNTGVDDLKMQETVHTSPGVLFFEELIRNHESGNDIIIRYKVLRSILERITKDLLKDDPSRFSSLFPRLNKVIELLKIDKVTTSILHWFRINTNNILFKGNIPSETDYLRDLKILCNAIIHFYQTDIPEKLLKFLPDKLEIPEFRRPVKQYERIRIEVLSFDDEFIYGLDEEHQSDEPVKVKYNLPEMNEQFNDTVKKLWKGCQLNLIDVRVDKDGIYYPFIIILEPDYLIDISSLAECMKDYGQSPLNFIMSRLETPVNAEPILLGNIANHFLDDLVNHDGKVDYLSSVRQAFKAAPVEISCSESLNNNLQTEATFFEDCEKQFRNIQNIINTTFPARNIDRHKATLEPHFICEQLGIQGRLDFLQLNDEGKEKFVIELKSGKAPFPESNTKVVRLNHQSQVLLYQIIIQKVLGIKYKELETFVLYSKYPVPDQSLRHVDTYMSEIKKILNVRNLIVANEHLIVKDRTDSVSALLIGKISADELINVKGLNPKFTDRVGLSIGDFKAPFHDATQLERDYFHAFYSFVTKEHYLSKAGDSNYNGSRGIASLWLSSTDEKLEAGEIITGLKIIKNDAADENPLLELSIPESDSELLPNFRMGDIVVLYERNTEYDNVTNKQVFKGAIESISHKEVKVRLRFRQRNLSVLPSKSTYAIEHDFLDSSYNSMYRGLYSFLKANKERRDLLLNQRTPQIDKSITTNLSFKDPELQSVILKAKQAKDYFLLIGPPGTGKTRYALKSMVEEFYSDATKNILLLAYTNRAVDEICEALGSIDTGCNYVRIGTELSCDVKYREYLLENLIRNCNKRKEVKAVIEGNRVFVGTIASMSNKTDLFRIKQFEVAIIDEASQILEPSLTGLLTVKHRTGENAIGKFILIGDHRQLPAVVLQSDRESITRKDSLNNSGVTNRRNSLFERLYGYHRDDRNSPMWSMLHRQFRMHPEIAEFPNRVFYNNQLSNGNAEHQLDTSTGFEIFDSNDTLETLISEKRLAFFPSKKSADQKNLNSKCNQFEALLIRDLVKTIYELYRKNGKDFIPSLSVGIITPYRSQIALIRKEIHNLNVPELNEITVDTVERYQGSQRDIIIYSFSVNEYYQLEFLSSIAECDGQLVDRKLNVAITRARKQLFVTGNPDILGENRLYSRFIEYIKSR